MGRITSKLRIDKKATGVQLKPMISICDLGFLKFGKYPFDAFDFNWHTLGITTAALDGSTQKISGKQLEGWKAHILQVIGSISSCVECCHVLSCFFWWNCALSLFFFGVSIHPSQADLFVKHKNHYLR